MFDRLSVRDRWTYVAIFALVAYGITFTIVRNLRPVGPAEIHGIPSGPPSGESQQTDVDERSGPTPATTQPTANSSTTDVRGQNSPSNASADPTFQDSAQSIAWLNRAPSDQLQNLPGVGPALADKIAAYRDANGPFSATSDLTKVGGIGQKRLAKIRAFLASPSGLATTQTR